MSTLLCRRSRMMKSPKRSLPTFPATTARTPSLASAVAVLAAQPPESARKSCVASNSPATGSRASGGMNKSATRTPAQTTSLGVGDEVTTVFTMLPQAENVYTMLIALKSNDYLVLR